MRVNKFRSLVIVSGVSFLDDLKRRTPESIVFKSAVFVNVFVHVIILHTHGQKALICVGIYAESQVTLIIAFLLLLFFDILGVNGRWLRFLLFFRCLLTA